MHNTLFTSYMFFWLLLLPVVEEVTTFCFLVLLSGLSRPYLSFGVLTSDTLHYLNISCLECTQRTWMQTEKYNNSLFKNQPISEISMGPWTTKWNTQPFPAIILQCGARSWHILLFSNVRLAFHVVVLKDSAIKVYYYWKSLQHHSFCYFYY